MLVQAELESTARKGDATSAIIVVDFGFLILKL